MAMIIIDKIIAFSDMSSLLFISTRPLTQNVMIRILSMRSASATAVPPPAKIQLPKPKEPGHIQYQRFWSRDKRYKPQVPGDTPARLSDLLNYSPSSS